MAIRVAYKLSRAQHQVAWEFAQQMGMPLEEVAKRALFWTIKEAYKQGDKEDGKSTSQNIEGNSQSVSASQDASPVVLANEAQGGDSSAPVK